MDNKLIILFAIWIMLLAISIDTRKIVKLLEAQNNPAIETIIEEK